MHSIQQVRSALKAHPLVAVLGLALIALVSSLAAALLGAVALACVVAPGLVEKRAPEFAVEGAVRAVKRHGLRVFQRAHGLKTDELGLQRALNAELLEQSRWQSRITKAFLKNDDAEARVCLEERRKHDQAVAELRVELDKQRAAVAGSLPAVEKAKADSRQAERSGLFLVIRRRRAESRKATALEASGFDEGVDELARMKAGIERAEDEAQAAEELLRTPVATSVAERYEREERDESIDAELQELKRKVGLSRPALNARAG